MIRTFVSQHSPKAHSQQIHTYNNTVLKVFSSFFRLTSRPICVVVVSPFHHAMLLFFSFSLLPRLFMHEIASRRFQLISNNRKTEGIFLFIFMFSEGRRLKNIDKKKGMGARYHWKMSDNGLKKGGRWMEVKLKFVRSRSNIHENIPALKNR